MQFSEDFNPHDLKILFEKRNGNVVAAYPSDFKGIYIFNSLGNGAGVIYIHGIDNGGSHDH